MVYANLPKLAPRNVVVPALLNLSENTPTPLKDWSPKVKGRFNVANVGIMTGNLIEVYAQIFAAEKLPMKPPYDKEKVKKIPIGKDIRGGGSETIPMDLELTREKAEEFIKGANLYFMGFANYMNDLYSDDGGKIPRPTVFCLQYDRKLQRFIPLPNDRDFRDYNDAE